MKKAKTFINSLTFKNWNKKPGEAIALIFAIVALAFAWSNEFLSILHEAPFPVSKNVDSWVQWILKLTMSVLGFIMLVSKKKNDIDIGLKITQEPTPDEIK